MTVNELLIKIDKLDKKIDSEHRESLKRKLITQEEITKLEDERKKAGFKGDFSAVEKYNLEIRKLNQKMNKDYSYNLKQQVKSLKREITNIIIEYYRNGKIINEIFEIEKIPSDIQEKWIKSSNFGKNSGYLFVDFIENDGENNWKYYNPITEVNLKSKNLTKLESKLDGYNEILFAFDENLAKQSKNRDVQLNPLVNYGWNNPNDIKSSLIKVGKSKKSQQLKSKESINSTKKKSKPKMKSKSDERIGSAKKKSKTKKKSKHDRHNDSTKNKSKVNNNQISSQNKKPRLSKFVDEKIDINSTDFKENYAIILDYLPMGYLNSSMTKFQGKPIAQAIGIDMFTFLELGPKTGVILEIGEVVYIGKGKRDKIYRILGKLDVENLTRSSILEIDDAIDEIVEAHEQRYVNYFNTSGSISMKLHGLGLLPGINGQMVRNILKERDRKRFKSFEDIKNRVPSVKNPQKNVSDKIREELNLIPQKKKHNIRIFTPIPKKTKKKKKRH